MVGKGKTSQRRTYKRGFPPLESDNEDDEIRLASNVDGGDSYVVASYGGGGLGGGRDYEGNFGEGLQNSDDDHDSETSIVSEDAYEKALNAGRPSRDELPQPFRTRGRTRGQRTQPGEDP